MSDAQALFALSVAVPFVVLGAIGMVRGYHMTLRIWKGDHDSKGDEHGND